MLRRDTPCPYQYRRKRGRLELWGGHECTVHRVGDRYGDQTRRSGHHDRPGDLDLFAGLGLKAIRYPVLWERVAPDAPGGRDWSWPDERLARLRALGLRPIVGLVHHGGGPRYTDLLDDGFAPGLADHARAVAERYPWVEDWTPVNEPLTTARFSALYGHWYPHASDERSFWLALLNEIDATGLAMAAVREVNPQARLVQTEDIGQAYGTAPLAGEVAFQNQRRWIGWDLLCGRVTPDHPLWARIAGFGFAGRLAALADAPCPPDILGANYYPTSERFLDHRAELYPDWTPGALGQLDMDAIRVLDPPPTGLEGLLQQMWDRYGLPMAVTERHLAGPVEDRMRWMLDAWSAGLRLQERGVDLRAVTSWSLLGSYDWSSLLTREDGVYEAGAFDLASGRPVRTELADLLAFLAAGGAPEAWLQGHPELARPGWWRTPERLLPVARSGAFASGLAAPSRPRLRPDLQPAALAPGT
jgi:dTDP-4-dehydrorhamnose reductase